MMGRAFLLTIQSNYGPGIHLYPSTDKENKEKGEKCNEKGRELLQKSGKFGLKKWLVSNWMLAS